MYCAGILYRILNSSRHRLDIKSWVKVANRTFYFSRGNASQLRNNARKDKRQRSSKGDQMTMASPKVVLVTGGNSGIGYETVKALLQSEKPYHILLGSRSLEKAKLAIETLHKECPESTNTVEVVQVDLTSDESIEKAFEKVKASPGHIDVLINNAGTHNSPLHHPTLPHVK